MTTIIGILSALALAYLLFLVYNRQKQKQQAFWERQFLNFLTQRGIISWGEVQFVPNSPKEDYVTRMTGFKPTSRYWIGLDEAWRKRVEAVEED